MQQCIPIIALTGGPGAGKSTALARFATFCQERGRHPLFVPETATILATSGLDKRDPQFQRYILEAQLNAEQIRLEAAKTGHYKDPIIICDRGAVDGLAYTTRGSFEAVLQELGLKLLDVLHRYDGVIFLDTAALGAESFYTTANNKAREESAEEARELNAKTLEAWIGARRIHHVDNRTGQTFEAKIARALQVFASLIGYPEPLVYEQKYQVEFFDEANLPKGAVALDIVQTYLVGRNGEERVRALGQSGYFLFYHTIKRRCGDGVAYESTRVVSRKEYDDLLIRADPERQAIHKTRYCFEANGRYARLDRFHGHRKGLTIFETEVMTQTEKITLPTSLGSFINHTGDDRFLNYNLALPT